MNDEPHKDRIVDEKPESGLKVDNDEEKQGKEINTDEDRLPSRAAAGT